jgi:hypothetical protein
VSLFTSEGFEAPWLSRRPDLESRTGWLPSFCAMLGEVVLRCYMLACGIPAGEMGPEAITRCIRMRHAAFQMRIEQTCLGTYVKKRSGMSKCRCPFYAYLGLHAHNAGPLLPFPLSTPNWKLILPTSTSQAVPQESRTLETNSAHARGSSRFPTWIDFRFYNPACYVNSTYISMDMCTCTRPEKERRKKKKTPPGVPRHWKKACLVIPMCVAPAKSGGQITDVFLLFLDALPFGCIQDFFVAGKGRTALTGKRCTLILRMHLPAFLHMHTDRHAYLHT